MFLKGIHCQGGKALKREKRRGERRLGARLYPSIVGEGRVRLVVRVAVTLSLVW
jgi:hypothetical protein